MRNYLTGLTNRRHKMSVKIQTAVKLLVTFFIFLSFCLTFTANTQAMEADNSAAAGFTGDPAPLEFSYATTTCSFTYATTTGTIGTRVTIAGNEFGKQQGNVLIGDKKCKIFSWSDSKIVAQIVSVISPPGHYDIKVVPKNMDNRPLVCPAGFEIMAPQITSIKPLDIHSFKIKSLSKSRDCDVFYMTGKYFGATTANLKVYFENEDGKDGKDGKLIKAKVYGWIMDPGTGMSYCLFNSNLEPGQYSVKIQNKVGESEPLDIMLTENCEIVLPE
jgi:hypothetical protein